MDRLLDDPVAIRGGEHGDETVHVVAEPQRPCRRGTENLQATVVVVEQKPADPADEKIEDPRREGLVPGVESRGLPAVDHVGASPAGRWVGEEGEHGGDLGRVVLAVAVEHHDPRAPAAGKALHESRRLPLAPGLVDSHHARITPRGGVDFPAGRVARSVVDDKQLPGEPGAIEHGADLGDQRADVPRFVAHRDDERDVRRRGVGCVHAFGPDGSPFRPGWRQGTRGGCAGRQRCRGGRPRRTGQDTPREPDPPCRNGADRHDGRGALFQTTVTIRPRVPALSPSPVPWTRGSHRAAECSSTTRSRPTRRRSA